MGEESCWPSQQPSGAAATQPGSPRLIGRVFLLERVCRVEGKSLNSSMSGFWARAESSLQEEDVCTGAGWRAIISPAVLYAWYATPLLGK